MIEKTLNKELADLAKVQRENEEEIFAKDNVVGFALGNKIKDGKDTGETSFQVLVQHKVESDLLSKDDMVPKTIKGTKTDVIEVGQIIAGPLAPDIEPMTQTRIGSDGPDYSDWMNLFRTSTTVPVLLHGDGQRVLVGLFPLQKFRPSSSIKRLVP